MPRALIATLVLTLLAGCPSYTTLQTPRTVAPGEADGTIAIGAAGTSAFDVPMPEALHLEIGANIGLAPNVNLWLRAELYSWVGGGLKLRFVDHPSFQAAIIPEAKLNLGTIFSNALASQTGRLDSNDLGWMASLPILFGIPMGEHLFVFGPKATLSNMGVTGTFEGEGGFGESVVSLFAGGMIAVDLEVAGIRIMPEFDLLHDFRTGEKLLHAGVSTRFGD